MGKIVKCYLAVMIAMQQQQKGKIKQLSIHLLLNCEVRYWGKNRTSKYKSFCAVMLFRIFSLLAI